MFALAMLDLLRQRQCPPVPTGSAEAWVEERKLFAGLTSSRALRRLVAPADARVVRVRCDRSLPFEYVDDFMRGCATAWGVATSTALSDYDPGLSQIESAGEHDVRILFLDWRLTARMKPSEAAAWVAGRATTALRSAPRAPVLLNNWPAQPADAWAAELNRELAHLPGATPGVYLLDLHRLCGELVGSCFDPRNDAVSKFPFSNDAAVAIARHLALDLLPSLVGPRVKAIAVDLDDTLVGGVLGEEGPSRVRIDAGHRLLHRTLADLRKAGTLLALCSRNERADVETLFRERRDLGLALSEFASVQVNWQPKAANLCAIARDLNIDVSAILFIDDNPSELAKARGALPGLRLLLADPEGTLTARALRQFPGLYRTGRDDAAAVRTQDIQANRERERLRDGAGDLFSYLAALRMEVDLYASRREHAARVCELSHKTNQFNLALARLGPPLVEEAFGGDHVAMTVGVRDALSDSGLVGAILARLEGDRAVVRELLFSCRVLGREIETLALSRFCGWLAARGARRVRFESVVGPRNQPARDWLARILPEGVESEMSALRKRLDAFCAAHPAMVREHR